LWIYSIQMQVKTLYKFDNWDYIVVHVSRSTDKKSLFIDAKRVIGSHNSKTGRQCNGQKKKMIYSVLKNTTQKTEDCAARIPLQKAKQIICWIYSIQMQVKTLFIYIYLHIHVVSCMLMKWTVKQFELQFQKCYEKNRKFA
jgi:hypothetical protein